MTTGPGIAAEGASAEQNPGRSLGQSEAKKVSHCLPCPARRWPGWVAGPESWGSSATSLLNLLLPYMCLEVPPPSTTPPSSSASGCPWCRRWASTSSVGGLSVSFCPEHQGRGALDHCLLLSPLPPSLLSIINSFLPPSLLSFFPSLSSFLLSSLPPFLLV